ncbi:hypothetical protein F7U66_00605 [Vibrio parahaemolyticus]|nr:hypothetical protein [Vibrio parahaemolyticus]
MLLDILNGYLFITLAASWLVLGVVLLSYKYGYEEVVAYPISLATVGVFYILSFGANFHLIGVIDGEHLEYLQVAVALLALGLAFVFALSVTEWYRRELKYVAFTIWSDMEVKSVERELDAEVVNVMEQFSWVVEMYTSNSRCLFKGREISSQVRALLYAKEYDRAFYMMSDHVEVFLLDKFTDIYRDNFQVMSQFGSVAENTSLLKVRVAESDLISKFLAEKSTALKALCFRGSIYQESDLEVLIQKNMKQECVDRLATQLSDLYLYKEEQGYEPSYKIN